MSLGKCIGWPTDKEDSFTSLHLLFIKEGDIHEGNMQEYKRLKPFAKGLFTGLVGELNMRRIEDANRQGYVFVKNTVRNYADYRHIACGHVTAYQHHHMSVGNVKCRHCMIARFKAEALERGYEYVDQTVAKDEATYTHTACGRQSVFQIAHMRVGNIKCHHCKIDKWKSDAIPRGFEFVRQLSKNDSEYIHTACGRSSSYSPSLVEHGSICCRHCQEDRYKAEADAQGYEWLKRAGVMHSFYIHKSCGGVQKKRLDAVRHGAVSCTNCEESWYTRKSGVYLLEIEHDGLSWLKLGLARNVKKRSKQYWLPESTSVKELFFTDYQFGRDAVTVENLLHKQFESYAISPDAIKTLMKSGFTECYKMDCKELLLDELRRIKESNECQKKS